VRGLCGLFGGLHGWRRRLRGLLGGLWRGLLGGLRRLLGLWRRLLGLWHRLLGGRLRRLLRAGKRRERTRAEQRHHDRERDRPSREPHRMTSWSRVSLSIWRHPAYLKRLAARKFAKGYNWPLLLSGGR